jgi:DNA-binding CsgD family transcriptional regulator
VFVLRGEAGIGKSALLHYCARQATGCRIVKVVGLQSELRMPFAALHQLCAPILTSIDALPEPQKLALRVAFGLEMGTTPDYFVVGLAVLSLLAEASSQIPLVCLVDDAQWIDEASSRVLGFVGRRLLAESVLLMMSIRETGEDRLFPALPDLTLDGLADVDARALLNEATPGKLDDRVRDRLVSETRGNPLALIELPRGMSRAELAGGFAGPLPTTRLSTTLSGQMEDLYVRRFRALPEPAQQLMQLAAADPIGDATILWRAAESLGLHRDAAAAASAEQLLDIGLAVRFRHPLVRSAVYAAATPADRRAAHLALAMATDPITDPELQAWHRAAAATGPDEDLAIELERTAASAQTRAGVAGAAAFLERSVDLTDDPSRRADRALAAGYANVQAGAFDTALGLLVTAEAAAVDDLQRARVEQLRGQIEWAANPGRDAPLLLLRAAKRLEALDAALARETYLQAWVASTIAGPMVGPEGQLRTASEMARSAPRLASSRPCDLLLDGLAAVVLDGRVKAEPILRAAITAFVSGDVSDDEWLQWGILAQIAAMAVWDFESWVVLSDRQVDVARASGALSSLAIALNARGSVFTHCGDFAAAAALADEKDAVYDATGIHLSSTLDLLLAAYRGRPSEAMPLLTATIEQSVTTGEGLAAQLAHVAAAALHNGLGQHHDAFASARQAADESYQPIAVQMALPDLVEAAVRSGELPAAEEAVRRLSTHTLEGSDWAEGLLARCRALVAERSEAERWYTEAIERLGRTRLRPELARTHLLYGEWLRAENRRIDARVQLHVAFELFTELPAEAFAERARRELVATGERVRPRGAAEQVELTSQEAHIARLARDGRSNSEIGAELFLSVRTVEWHLRKVFTKLSISSRRELKDVLDTSL